jgi:cyclase
MLNRRVIPCLLLRNGGLVKSVKFKDFRYVGDPVNAVRIFNDKEVDELVFLDIACRTSGAGPNFELLADITSEAFMPFGYGGGIRDLDDIKKLYALGVEKVILNTVAETNPLLITHAAEIAGSSGVVVSIDVKKSLFGRNTIVTNSGTKDTGLDPVQYAKKMEALGAGEILLNSINRDGTMQGYDIDLIAEIASQISIPVVAVGGAGAIGHFREAIEAGASAVGAGSMFVFHGKHHAVLITYPSSEEIKDISR